MALLIENNGKETIVISLVSLETELQKIIDQTIFAKGFLQRLDENFKYSEISMMINLKVDNMKGLSSLQILNELNKNSLNHNVKASDSLLFYIISDVYEYIFDGEKWVEK